MSPDEAIGELAIFIGMAEGAGLTRKCCEYAAESCGVLARYAGLPLDAGKPFDVAWAAEAFKRGWDYVPV